jgi:DNA-binding transcriptional MerR regulator
MNVNDLARRVGIAPHVVRYYTQYGLLSPVRNARNAYREYAESDVRRLQFVCRAKVVGFTLDEIAMILEAADGGEPPSSRLRQVVQARALQNERRLVDAQRLQKRIHDAIEEWEGAAAGVADLGSLRRFVDALSGEE